MGSLILRQYDNILILRERYQKNARLKLPRMSQLLWVSTTCIADVFRGGSESGANGSASCHRGRHSWAILWFDPYVWESDRFERRTSKVSKASVCYSFLASKFFSLETTLTEGSAQWKFSYSSARSKLLILRKSICFAETTNQEVWLNISPLGVKFLIN